MKNATTHHIPVEVDVVNPAEEKQSDGTRKTMTHYSCQPTK
jgi:hypothetical protein